MRPLLTRAVLISSFVFALSCRPADAPAKRSANVVLFVVDTLRADYLGCYGYPRATSDRIDALAARGTRYEDARSQGSWTIPSMLSMLSGLYVTTGEERLPPDRATLADVVRDAGIETAAFVANAVITRYPEELAGWFRRARKGSELSIADVLSDRHAELTENVLRTPLILAGPGFPAGVKRGGLVGNLDLYPTILAALAVDVPEPVAGVDLASVDPARGRIFARGNMADAVVDGRGFKLISRTEVVSEAWQHEWARPFLEESREFELFDLTADPEELEDASAARPEILESLSKALESWRMRNARVTDDTITDHDRAMLEQLGYLDDAAGRGD